MNTINPGHLIPSAINCCTISQYHKEVTNKTIFFKNSIVGAGIVAKQPKLWPEAPVSHWMTAGVLAVPLTIQFPTNGLGKHQKMAQVPGLLGPPSSRPMNNSCLQPGSPLITVVT